MATQPVLVDKLGAITQITINRPESRNSLTVEAVRLLTEAFTFAAADDSVRAILLRGSGTDAFCAGADLSELKDANSPDQRRSFFLSIAALIESITRCPTPVIAQVQGFALAGGCGLVAAADIVVASEDSVFGLPEVAIGLAPMVVMAPLVRAIGFRAVSELTLTGERISASRALSLGLVSQLVSKADLEAAAMAICTTISSRGPAAVRASKHALADIYEAGSLSFMQELADRSALVSINSEASEGIAAFTEKREPSWRKPLSQT